MKNSKLILFLVLLITGFALQAQSICYPTTNRYIVDATDTEEPTDDGTYAWTITSNGNDFSNQITTGEGPNIITVNWEDEVFVLGTYTITVVETFGSCPGEPRTFEVILSEGYIAPGISNITPICVGDETNTFLLTGGTENAIVGYTITSNNNGFNDITATVTLDASGNGTISYPPLTDENSSETFTLTLNTIDDSGLDSCQGVSITNNNNNTASVIINPIPVTSDITPVPNP